MKIKDRQKRDLKIFQYLSTDHIFIDAARHFKLSINQLFLINKKIKLRVVDMIKTGQFSQESVAEQMRVRQEYILKILADFDKGKLKPDSEDLTETVRQPESNDIIDEMGAMS